MAQEISGLVFDLSSPVYLLHPSNKFWEATLNGLSVKFRVGKLRGGSQHSVDEVDKDYATHASAKSSVVSKIEEKLIKGYYSKDAKQAENKSQTKTEKKQPQKKSQGKGKNFSGEYYEKGSEAIKIEVNEKRVKITRVDSSGVQRFEIRSMESYQQAVDFCLKQQQWITGEGYKANHTKFTYTFVDDVSESKEKGKQDKAVRKKGDKNGNFLSVVQMTDDAISHRSRNVSETKSDRSYVDHGSEDQKYLQRCSYKLQDRGSSQKVSHKKNKVLQKQTTCKVLTKQKSVRKFIEFEEAKMDKCMKKYSENLGPDNQLSTPVPSKLGNPISSCIKVLLAETWSDDADPTGWSMSEKLDGVRMFWTGTTMYSRNGNRFYFPKFFTKNWPNSQMDGELFIGRGMFSKTLSAVKKTNPIDQQWKKVNYLVFDAPGLKKPFKTRIMLMEEVIKAIDNPYIKCHGHRQCKGYEDLFEELEKVNKIEGEGLMLRDPESFYENRRSKSLLKVKTFHDDEATVLGYNEGTGRCQGMVGALRVRNTHGVEFEVGSGMTDAIRRKPPKIGTKITYKYQEFNKDSGKPRFPTFLRAFDHI